MQFVRNKCINCACANVCKVKTDIELFRNDLMNLGYFGGIKYASLLPQLTVRIECNNYIDKTQCAVGSSGG